MTSVNFYDKEQTDDLLDTKADKSDTYTKAQIDEKQIGATTDTASSSGSLWARIKYVLAHWLTADTEQTVSAKKTFSVSPEVPTSPATPESAVNSVYVNDSTDGVNNIAHKTGNERYFNDKIFAGSLEKSMSNFDITSPPSSYVYSTALLVTDKNDQELARIMCGVYPDGRTSIEFRVRNSDGTRKHAIVYEGDVI